MAKIDLLVAVRWGKSSPGAFWCVTVRRSRLALIRRGQVGRVLVRHGGRGMNRSRSGSGR